MISINAYFSPFRIHLKREKKAELFVQITNKGHEEKMIAIEFACDRHLGFGMPGSPQKISEKNPGFKAGETKKWYLDVLPKQVSKPCALPVQIKVEEFYRDYQHPIKTHIKRLDLSIGN